VIASTRNVSIHLKPNMLSDYTRTFEKDVLRLLRKQNGSKVEIVNRKKLENSACECYGVIRQYDSELGLK